MRSSRCGWARAAVFGGVALGILVVAGCGDVVGTATLPAGTQSPGAYNNPDGAIGMYNGAKWDIFASLEGGGQISTTGAIVLSGAISDELTSSTRGSGPTSVGAVGDPVDERIVPEGTPGAGEKLYGVLQKVRGEAMQAIGLLAHYAPKTSPALRGEMYATQGYAEVLLADLYCSGVPLSTLDFEADYTYKPGSTTTEVYRHAIALFDSALALSADSVNAQNFARVAKGRAWLALGAYDSAAAAVHVVPDTFRYRGTYTWTHAYYSKPGYSIGYEFGGMSVADHEGGNGLPFVTGQDPRTPVIYKDVNQFGVARYWPAQYQPSTTTPVVLASGIEARLIEAEAALHAGQTTAWLAKLNALRTTCTTAASCPTPAPAGSGGVAGLPPLADPGTPAARVDLMFAERAAWLFLTAHRQGDLRRLVRAYTRPSDTVYPIGLYYGGQGTYGNVVALPIPEAERRNPHFHGCLAAE